MAAVPRTGISWLHDPKAGGGRWEQKQQCGEKVEQAKHDEKAGARSDAGRGRECGGFSGRREVVARGVARGVLAGSPGGMYYPLQVSFRFGGTLEENLLR